MHARAPTRRRLPKLVLAASTGKAFSTQTIRAGALISSEVLAELAVPANDSEPVRRVWIQIAEAGVFKGHHGGEFTLDADAFRQITRNLQLHPSYKRGADQLGSTRVVPIDYKHASEQPAKEIAATGAPAQGWVYDCTTRTSASGTAQLWGLVEWLEPARTQIREGRYQWMSVAIWPDAIHPRSGDEIGWYMSSVALTNDPFIQGMVPIAASREPAGENDRRRSYDDEGLELYRLPYEMPQSTDELLCELREMLGLEALAGLVEIKASVSKLEAYIADPTSAPAGVDVAHLVSCLRALLNLPLSSSPGDTFGAFQKIAVSPTPPVEATLGVQRSTPMTIAILLALASTLKVAPTVVNAAQDGTPKSQAALEFETVKGLEHLSLENESNKKTIGKLLEKSGESTVDGLLVKLDAGLKAVTELAALRPEIEALKEAKTKAEADAIAADVEAVVAFHRLPDAHRPALLHFRKTDEKGFATAYPAPPPGMPHLGRNLATNRKGDVGGSVVQLSGLRPAKVGSPPPRAIAGSAGTTRSELSEKLALCEGRNTLERAMTYLKANGHERATHETLHASACELVRVGRESGELPTYEEEREIEEQAASAAAG